METKASLIEAILKDLKIESSPAYVLDLDRVTKHLFEKIHRALIAKQCKKLEV